jgi:hypothetical protein
VRNARIETRSIPLPVRRDSAAPARSPRLKTARRSARGVRFQVDRVSRVERWLPLLENALTTAGYLVLTAGAVVLLFKFAP